MLTLAVLSVAFQLCLQLILARTFGMTSSLDFIYAVQLVPSTLGIGIGALIKTVWAQRLSKHRDSFVLSNLKNIIFAFSLSWILFSLPFISLTSYGYLRVVYGDYLATPFLNVWVFVLSAGFFVGSVLGEMTHMLHRFLGTYHTFERMVILSNCTVIFLLLSLSGEIEPVHALLVLMGRQLTIAIWGIQNQKLCLHRRFIGRALRLIHTTKMLALTLAATQVCLSLDRFVASSIGGGALSLVVWAQMIIGANATVFDKAYMYKKQTVIGKTVNLFGLAQCMKMVYRESALVIVVVVLSVAALFVVLFSGYVSVVATVVGFPELEAILVCTMLYAGLFIHLSIGQLYGGVLQSLAEHQTPSLIFVLLSLTVLPIKVWSIPLGLNAVLLQSSITFVLLQLTLAGYISVRYKHRFNRR